MRWACTRGLGLSLGLASLFGAPAWAQVPTPPVVPRAQDLAPPTTGPDTAAALPERPGVERELGKPDDDVRIDVSAYRVDDSAPPELRAALAEITARYTGKQRGFEDLVNAAAEVTRFLQRDLGYYLGYAYLPEQSPASGVVRIAVLEGRLDRVLLNWPGDLPVRREVVEAYLARLEPGSILRVRDVERVVFLVNDLRGITARFEVRAGSTPGTAALVVTPSAEGVWSGKLEADANGSKSVGRDRLGGLAQMNSPFGRGDGFTANVQASTTGGLAFALLGYNSPLGSDGLKLGASLSAVRYQLDRKIFPLDLNGSATTLNAYGLYPLVRSRNLNLFTLLSLEHKQYEDRNSISGTRKTVDALALGITGDFRDSLLGGGVNTYEASLASGEVKYPDGRSAALEDDPRFTKLSYGFTRLQDVLTGRLLAYLSLRGQFVGNNLDTTEQFRLGGLDGVRAFPVGEITGDIGTVASLELRLLPPEAWFGRVAREMVFSAFVDAGSVQYRYRPRATSTPGAQRNTATFSGAGLGVTWVRAGAYALRLGAAKPISGTSRGGEQPRDVRFYLQASKFFN